MNFRERLQHEARAFAALLRPQNLAPLLLGAAILSFGLHNIHSRTSITEGGVLGLLLFFNHWTGLPASLVSPVLDLACYLAAWRYLGGGFIRTSLVSTAAVAGFFKLWEVLPYALPDLSPYPLLAAVAGGLFVGLGVGMIVRQGGSSGGDDALALTISRLTRWRLSRCYLFTDLVVLGLSLTYIPVLNIAFSLVTVTISSLLIDKVQNFGLHKEEAGAGAKEKQPDPPEKQKAARPLPDPLVKKKKRA